MFIYYDINYTLKEIINGKSFVRFGDGEIRILMRKKIRFQVSTPELIKKFHQLLNDINHKNYIFGLYYVNSLNKAYKSKPKYYNRFSNFINNILNKYEKLNSNGDLLCHDPFIFRNKQLHTKNIIFDYLKNKNIVYISGHDISDDCYVKNNAKNFHKIITKLNNCFDDYNIILKKCLEFDKSYIFLCVCGPCAKILVYDLTNLGYQGIDMGYGFIKNKWNK
jgi:hypothetical protein